MNFSSLGLVIAPRIRFLKNIKKKEKNSEEENEEECETEPESKTTQLKNNKQTKSSDPAFSFHSNDDFLFRVKRVDHSQSESEAEEVLIISNILNILN